MNVKYLKRISRLMPCPFCGFDVDIFYYEEFGGKWVKVACRQCTANKKQVVHNFNYFSMAATAHAMWNSRFVDGKYCPGCLT